MNQHKKILSLALAACFVFHDTGLAQQNESDLEFKKSVGLVSLISQKKDQIISGLSGLSAAGLTYFIMTEFDIDPNITEHRRLQNLTDIELLTIPDRFQEYVIIRNRRFRGYKRYPTEKVIVDKDLDQYIFPGSETEVRQVTLPGTQHPSIQWFFGVNSLMETYKPNLSYSLKENRFTYVDPDFPNLASGTASVEDIGKFFNCVQYIDDPSKFNSHFKFWNLLDSIQLFGEDRILDVFNIVSPDAFDQKNYPKLKKVLVETMGNEKIKLIELESRIKAIPDFDGRWISDPFIDDGFMTTHEKVIKSRISSRKMGKIALSTGIGLLVGTVIYLWMERKTATEPSIIDKYNLSYEDVSEMMTDDIESYKIILEKEPIFKKQMAQAYDRLNGQIHQTRIAFKAMDQYKIDHPEFFHKM